MSFRIEEKIFLKDFNIFEFKKWLVFNNSKKLYPSRIINSIYFDNYLRMYRDSNEGVVPRKKLRIRTYGNKKFFLSKNNFFKETKITYYNYRDKIVEPYKFSKNKFILGLIDNAYGYCKPNLNVVYKRNYYKVFDLRITIDENINYRSIRNQKLSNHPIFDEGTCVIEIKTNNLYSTDRLKEFFPLARSRFSKYCRGIEITNII